MGTGLSCSLAGGYSSGMSVRDRAAAGGRAGRRAVPDSGLNRRRRVGPLEVHGAVLSLRGENDDWEFGETTRDEREFIAWSYWDREDPLSPPCDTPISRLSDVVPPNTASTPAAASPVGRSRVRFPRPKLLNVTSKTSGPPAGPGMTTWELLLLLVTNTLGGLLEAAAHRAMDMVI